MFTSSVFGILRGMDYHGLFFFFMVFFEIVLFIFEEKQKSNWKLQEQYFMYYIDTFIFLHLHISHFLNYFSYLPFFSVYFLILYWYFGNVCISHHCDLHSSLLFLFSTSVIFFISLSYSLLYRSPLISTIF